MIADLLPIGRGRRGYPVAGRVALITGAGRGIGRELAAVLQLIWVWAGR